MHLKGVLTSIVWIKRAEMVELKQVLVICLLAALLLTAGCVQEQEEEYPEGNILPSYEAKALTDSGRVKITKFYFFDENVTCFVFQGFYKGGISCLEGGH